MLMGRRQLMASKSFVMVMAVVLITLLLYGIKCILGFCGDKCAVSIV